MKKSKKLLRKVLAGTLALTVVSGVALSTTVGSLVGANTAVSASYYADGNPHYYTSDDGINYTYWIKSDGTAQVVNYYGIPKTITTWYFPSVVDGRTVTTIGYDSGYTSTSFWKHDLENVTEIVIPDTVEELSNLAFNGVSKLKSIILPKNLKKIGFGAFYDCSSLQSIFLPDSIEEIGERAFGECKALTSIQFPVGLKSVESYAFMDCQNLKNVRFPFTVETVHDNTFYGIILESLQIDNPNVVFEESLYRTDKILALEGSDIQKQVEEHNSTNLYFSNVEFEAIVPEYSDGTYTYQLQLDKTFKITDYKGTAYGIDIPDEYYGVSTTVVGEGAISSAKLETITVPKSISVIEKDAFINCDNLYDVTVLNAKASLGEHCIGYRTLAAGRYDTTYPERQLGINGYTNSTAQKYADDNDIYFSALDTELFNNTTIPFTKVGIGTTYNFNVKASGGSGSYQYGIYVTEPNSIISERLPLIRYTDSPSKSVSFTKLGNYVVSVYVKDTETGIVKSGIFKIDAGAALANNSTISAEEITLGESVTVNAAAQGGTGRYLYSYNYDDGLIEQSPLIGKNSTIISNPTSFTVTPTTSGVHTIKAIITDTSGTVQTKTFTVQVKEPYEELSNDSTVSKTEFNVGESVTVTGAASGGSGTYTYEFYYKRSTASTWSKFGSATTATFKPSSAGTFDIKVNVKDSEGASAAKEFKLTVTSGLVNNSTVSTTNFAVGETVTVKGAATGGSGTYTYEFYYKRSTASTGTKFGSATTATFKPSSAGTFDIKVNVKDSEGASAAKEFKLTATSGLVNNSTVSTTNFAVGETVTVKGAATGGSGTYT
ncbi:MAG: leucine-rich repeat protein, partial [Clostridia bacterium]|nr:leucine-rich repeat protein [Clostridia bacterium]